MVWGKGYVYYVTPTRDGEPDSPGAHTVKIATNSASRRYADFTEWAPGVLSDASV